MAAPVEGANYEGEIEFSKALRACQKKLLMGKFTISKNEKCGGKCFTTAQARLKYAPR
jgi:hypothetical protein